jgi:hypothetical protein
MLPQKKSILYDFSIQQMSRPLKAVVVNRPLIADLDEVAGGFIGALGNGCEIVYEPIDDDSYQFAPDWTRPLPKGLLDAVTSLIEWHGNVERLT